MVAERPTLTATGGSPRRSSRTLAPALWAVVVAGAAGIVWISDHAGSETVAGLALAYLVILVLVRVPLGIAMAFVGSLGLYAIGGWNAVGSVLRETPHRTAASWSLSVLPMFILMGVVLWRSGVTESLYTALQRWLRWLPGSLAGVTNAAGGVLAAVSGSTLGITYALTKIAVPEMLKAGYDKRLSIASVLMAGTGGQLIPPSVLLVVYAGIAETPLGDQLVSGVVPGLLLVGAFGLAIVTLAAVRPGLAPRTAGEASATGERASLKLLTFPLLIAGVVGGLYAGVFTATEAGAVGAIGAVVVAALFKGLGRALLGCLRQSFTDALVGTGNIFFLLMGANVLRRLINLSGIPAVLTGLVDDWDLGRVGLILVLVALFLVLGMFMDGVSVILIAVPILLPTVNAVGIDLVWFGVFVVLMGEIAAVTPPVGIVVFVVHGILVDDPDVRALDRVTLGDVFTAALWFLPVAFVVLAVLVVFPGLVLY